MEMLAIAIWVLIGGITSHYAQQRGRGPIAWFMLGLLFGLFALLALFMMPSLAQDSEEQSINQDSGILLSSIKEVSDNPYENTEWYYVNKEHEQQGPVSYHQLLELWNMYQVDLTTYVWCDGMLDWKRFDEVFDKNSRVISDK